MGEEGVVRLRGALALFEVFEPPGLSRAAQWRFFALCLYLYLPLDTFLCFYVIISYLRRELLGSQPSFADGRFAAKPEVDCIDRSAQISISVCLLGAQAFVHIIT